MFSDVHHVVDYNKTDILKYVELSVMILYLYAIDHHCPVETG